QIMPPTLPRPLEKLYFRDTMRWFDMKHIINERGNQQTWKDRPTPHSRGYPVSAPKKQGR
ncbi:hypothetical protein, partial [Pseudomonas sp. 74_A]|uniref:hypothetical protein n=1 Tax=Pseudomonas sp. 74_A TaxID=2813565 RepID=UPI001A9EFDE1